ncbi:MAG TPA: peptidase C39 family protein [Anaerolineales bacterium]|nr:peptidase C39 family protein [Anaerolineales bacterium]
MKNKILILARFAFIGVLMLNTHEASSVSAKGKGEGGYQTGFARWRAAENGFSGWTLNGVQLNQNHELEFDSATAAAGSDPYAAGTYNGGNYYNGGSFVVGEATSPEITSPFNYKEAIASWNASTPAGSWLEVQFRAQYGTRWSKWYILGIWASDYSTIRRHSVQSQGDSDGYVAVDTFVSSNKKETTNKFQLKFRLFSTNGATPGVRNASVAYSTSAPKTAAVSAGNPALWNKLITVPQCSQMVYPDGGEVWCSPTSTSMVLGYWNNDTGPCEPRVRAAVDGVFDWIYNGHGNWPFNTAYAATFGYEGYVARFTSLARAEEYIAAGVPVIMSIAWGKGDLTGADIDSTNGHLLVLIGFDAAGNPIVNDPASPANESVQHTYLRSEFEPLWLQASGGTVYLIYPQGSSVPAVP